MPSQALTYVTEVHGQYKYWPTWLPTTRLSIGDIGILEEGVFFKKKRPASKFGVSKAALKQERLFRDSGLRFTSNGGVQLKTQGHGKNAKIPTLPQGEVGAEITFTRANATVLAATGVYERRLADQYLLEQELKKLVECGTIQPEYVVVTDLISASSARILISTEANQSITLCWR